MPVAGMRDSHGHTIKRGRNVRHKQSWKESDRYRGTVIRNEDPLKQWRAVHGMSCHGVAYFLVHIMLT